ncbi:alpha-amylase [Phaffia rhodozyma]|uniref:Alpha-amylase n=1 Tax=Phaffia rhodozyma TaxID=264483 RepID=A0A0F7SMD9_PHARH|nr:alpha-amylase [Phaffia rhodozyma]
MVTTLRCFDEQTASDSFNISTFILHLVLSTPLHLVLSSPSSFVLPIHSLLLTQWSATATEELSHPEIKSVPANFTMIQYFEWYAEGNGVHWKKFSKESKRLGDMGITAAWLPPPTCASSTESTGYDIYDLYDLGEFDQKGGQRTHWGTKEELVSAIETAKGNGVLTYIDAVLNHKAGADKTETFQATEVDSNDRNKEITDAYDIDGWTGFSFPGRGDKYSKLKWNFNHFTGVDWDDKGKKKSIFKIHGDGKTWAKSVSGENGNYDYLMFADIDHHHPEVIEDLNNWGTWILKESGAAGFRFDAIKHIDREFIGQFVKHVRKEIGNDKLFCVGEFWEDSLGSLENYVDTLGTQFSVFDCPLHYNFKEAGERGAEFDMRQIWDGTIVQSRPIDAVTLVDNHDTQRGQSLESWVNPQFKPLAYALILLRVDGYPCVFYGDLYGCGGDNPQEPVTQLEDFIRARKWYAYGELRDYSDHQNCLGWVRMGDEEHPDGCAVVLSNGGDGFKRMEVGKERAGQKWTDLLGWKQGEVVIGEDGWAEFPCNAVSVSIWVKEDAKFRDTFKKD